MFKALCASLAMLALSAPPAAAEQASSWRGVAGVRVIAYSDLDLSRTDDRTALLARIQAASEELCRDTVTINGRRRCVQNHIERAVAHAPEPARLALQDMMGDALERRLAQR